MVDLTSTPGAAWLEVVSRPTLSEFSTAFCAHPILEATVAQRLCRGIDAIFDFFRTTRTMYERIAFVSEIRSGFRTCLEWEGTFKDTAVSGATIIAHDEKNAITQIRLFHVPYEQLIAFSAELVRRRESGSEFANNSIGARYENER